MIEEYISDYLTDEKFDIHGSKGGAEKPYQPVETPNNLISVARAKVLLAVAEGELAGNPRPQDIFLDGTPLYSDDGSANFGGVTWEWRSGRQDQTYIQGLPEVSTEYNVGFELKQVQPWTRLITTPNLDAVRVTFSWPALLEQKQNGDTVGYSIDYEIQVSVDGGPFISYQKYNVTGKTNSPYERTHRINLNPATTSWTIRAIRLTPDNTTGRVQDTMTVKSYSEVVDVKQRYPNTALLYVEFDSRHFGGGAIPRVSVKTRGRLIRVPNNYDPETRTYTGVWNGAWKFAWTDNPAWVYHDIVTNDRFGLGNRVNLNMVDKFALYEIAQYCDVMVDNGLGNGGKEPRATCNIYIQEKQEAWQVLRDIASIFNGMTYWNGNQFTAIADKREPFDNAPVFSRTNVLNGRFDYAAADNKSIYTSALISFDDPENHFNTAVESTFETSEILRWGPDRQTEISAIGCTSRGEAQRRGKYTLLTNMFNRSVSFRTGLQGISDDVKPGKLIHVVDPLIGGRQFTGRLIAATGRVLTLDRDTEAKPGDIMYVTRSNGITQGRTILSVNGRIVTVQTQYAEQPAPNAVWYLESADLKSQLFRVTKITQPEESIFEIEGVEYNDSKHGAIDNGARLEPRPISVVPPGVQQPPKNPRLSSFTFVEQTMAVTTMNFSWDSTPNAISYEAQWRYGNNDWVNLGTTGSLEFNVRGIYAGDYIARVRAINAFGIKSVWSTSMLTPLEGKAGKPPRVTDLVTTPLIFGIRLDWYFPEGATDTLRTEFRYSENEDFNNSIPLGDFAYPIASHEMHGLNAGKRFWFWCRLHDRTGNIGEWFPYDNERGVTGQTMLNDGGAYNDYFAGLISETALDKELYDRIELIDGDGPGSVNERLDQAVSELEDKIANITDALVYDPEKEKYDKGDVVRLGQKLYQAQKEVPKGVSPPNPEYWKDVGEILEDANNMASRLDIVEVKVEELDGVVTSTVTSIESMQARWRDDDGVGEQEDAIAGWNNKAAINTEREVRANQNEAIARELVTFKAEVDENKASIISLTQVVADNNEALGTRIDTLTVSVNDNDTAVKGLIQSEATARANADGALAQRIDTTQVAVGENTASIQQTSSALATTNGKVNAAWTLKMEVNSQGQYVAAGIGLGIENGPAGLQSQFLVRADRFAVVNGTNTTTSAPFVVSGGQVFISQALIGNGWITNAMIGNVIQSDNWQAQYSGWFIRKDGYFEMNGVGGTGRMAMSNNYLRFYHANGVLGIDLSI